ncbi:MAG: hypothetical protein ACFFD4_33295 [Candidatus Odinarchaeota archaeon]
MREQLTNDLIGSFDVIDPFNTTNRLKGFIYRDISHYGDLRITRVNGKPCEQYIHTTPKFSYPPEGELILLKELIIYEKLDGTNICLYPYRDAEWNTYWSCKTRLRPVLGKSSFGQFLEWTEQKIAEHEDFINILKENPAYAYSFELYGSVNKVLIEYEVPLDFKYIFKIDQKNGNLYPPVDHPLMGPKCVKPRDGTVNLQELAMTLQKDMERRYENNPVEGVMIYGKKTGDHDGGRWEVYKCKPAQIFDVMREQASPYIQREEIKTTMKNALEVCDDEEDIIPTTCELLQETYGVNKIQRSMERIKAAKEELIEELDFKRKVTDVMSTCPYEIAPENRDQVMRWVMSKDLFSKNDATRVFNVIFR